MRGRQINILAAHVGWWEEGDRLTFLAMAKLMD
jgi:hypothetical protein